MSASAPLSSKPVTVPDFLSARARGVRLTMLTAYDYSMARLLDEGGVDAILVGDSLGMVMQGNANALTVTLDEMIYHTRCVARGVTRCLIVADLPFLSYQVSPGQAVRSAGKLLKAGAHAVKLEGGVRMLPALDALQRADIPVMGHVGLTPQSVHRMGGFKVQRDAEELLADARAVEAAGAFSLVVEGVPTAVGKAITEMVTIPTIGIGAGPDCDGQVLVWHDLLGLFDGFRPKFVKRYAELGVSAREALAAYCAEVRSGAFPGAEHGFQ